MDASIANIEQTHSVLAIVIADIAALQSSLIAHMMPPAGDKQDGTASLLPSSTASTASSASSLSFTSHAKRLDQRLRPLLRARFHFLAFWLHGCSTLVLSTQQTLHLWDALYTRAAFGAAREAVCAFLARAIRVKQRERRFFDFETTGAQIFSQCLCLAIAPPATPSVSGGDLASPVSASAAATLALTTVSSKPLDVFQLFVAFMLELNAGAGRLQLIESLSMAPLLSTANAPFTLPRFVVVGDPAFLTGLAALWDCALTSTEPRVWVAAAALLIRCTLQLAGGSGVGGSGGAEKSAIAAQSAFVDQCFERMAAASSPSTASASKSHASMPSSGRGSSTANCAIVPNASTIATRCVTLVQLLIETVALGGGGGGVNGNVVNGGSSGSVMLPPSLASILGTSSSASASVSASASSASTVTASAFISSPHVAVQLTGNIQRYRSLVALLESPAAPTALAALQLLVRFLSSSVCLIFSSTFLICF